MKSNAAKAKVLVVDDEEAILASIADLLEPEFDVTTTSDPTVCLESLTRESVMVLISDQRMPRMNGDELLRCARERSAATRVLLTGFADIEALGRVVNEGRIYAYVTKPWDPLTLRTTVRNAANEYKLTSRLRYERDLMRTLMDNIPDSVYVQDAEQRYTLVNRAFAQLAMLASPEMALGKTEVECLPGTFGITAAEDGKHILTTGEPVVSKVDELTLPDKSPRWFSSTRVPVRSPHSGEIESLAGISVDVTKHVELERNLQRAKENVEETVRAKQEFLSRTSHDIRTPLNSILGMTELLAETQLTPQQRDYLRICSSNGKTLMRLLSDLIDLSRIDLQDFKLTIAPLSPREATHAVIESLEKQATAKGVGLLLEYGSDIPPRLLGDVERLKQVLANLVNNALKFTREGQVLVKVSCLSIQDNVATLEFSVEDTGIGIENDKLEKIFEPFSQGEEFVTGKYGGTGLGLTLSRQLVHQMGGCITVESSPGSGSLFRFTAKLEVAEAKPSAQAARPKDMLTKESFGGLKMLLAEDNADNVALIRAHLGSVALDVASNGREAVEKFTAGKYDIVLMDLQMPEMDGLQATRLIREWEFLNRRTATPILACTAHAYAEEESLQAGCTGHLLKPLFRQTLYSALAKYARNSLN